MAQLKHWKLRWLFYFCSWIFLLIASEPFVFITEKLEFWSHGASHHLSKFLFFIKISNEWFIYFTTENIVQCSSFWKFKILVLWSQFSFFVSNTDWFGSPALFPLGIWILCVRSTWQMRITNPKNLPLGGGRGFLL